MIGLDTNVLVRYIVEDDLAQEKLARHVIEERCSVSDPAFVNPVVLCELTWVLRRAYGCSRGQIAAVLLNLLLTETILVEHHETAWQAYCDYVECTAEYADCLISRMNGAKGCATTLTFDKKAAALPNTDLLKQYS